MEETVAFSFIYSLKTYTTSFFELDGLNSIFCSFALNLLKLVWTAAVFYLV